MSQYTRSVSAASTGLVPLLCRWGENLLGQAGIHELNVVRPPAPPAAHSTAHDPLACGAEPHATACLIPTLPPPASRAGAYTTAPTTTLPLNRPHLPRTDLSDWFRTMVARIARVHHPVRTSCTAPVYRPVPQVTTPTHVMALASVNVIKVVCGEQHTLVITDEGEVLAQASRCARCQMHARHSTRHGMVSHTAW